MPLSDRPIQGGSREAVVLSDAQNPGREGVTATPVAAGVTALDVNVVQTVGAAGADVNVHDGVGTPLTSTTVGPDQALDVNIVAGAGAGGTSMTDDTAFTPGVTGVTPAAGTYRSVRDPVDDNDAGALAMTQRRALLTAIETPAGDSAMDEANDALRVNIVAGAGAGGTSMVDDAPFTPGTTPITPAGAMFDDAAPDSVDEGDGGVVRMSANRNLYVTMRDAAGNERGLNIAADNTVGINDAGGSLSVDDAGGTLTVDDGGLSLSVDDGGTPLDVDLSLVGGAAVATNAGNADAGTQRVVLATDQAPVAVQADVTGINGTIDANNSSVALLGIGAVFTGVSTDTLDVAHVSVFAFSNVASAVDGLSIEWSTDNVNWDETDDFTIPAGNAKIFSFGPPARYMRVIYTNGGVGQAAFRLQTILKSVRVKPSSHRINDPILTEDDAELVKAVLTGENPGGNFINFGATAGGNFQISIEEINGAAIMPVEGDTAHDDVDAGNPVKVGGKATVAEPAAVANLDRVDAYFDENGYQHVKLGAGAAAIGTVTIQEPLSVDDNGGSLTVDNAALSVVGGGVEATALRVTIANDSTGLLSVDDGGGSLTVDGGVTADIRDGAGVALTSTLVGADQALDVNIVQTVGGAGGTSMVDDAVFTPATTSVTPIAGFADDTAPDSVDEGDAGAVRMSLNRNLNVRIRDDAGNERGLNIDAAGAIAVTNTVLSVVGGGAEATAQRVTLANDSTGTLTIDNPALSVVGGGVEAAALRVTIANDSTGVLSVDDNAGSLTVDNPILSVVGGGTEATAQRVTIANDSTGVLTVDDGGDSLTIDNATLSVVDGGVEATALRVTIANDSTGLLSIDDNGGSLTVDQATHDNLNLNANMQVGDADVANGNPVPVSDAGGSLTVDGAGTSMIDDAVFTPATTAVTPIAAFADDTAPDSVDEGDAGVVRMSLNRSLNVRIRDDAGNERGLNIDATGGIATNLRDGAGTALTSTLVGADQSLDVNIAQSVDLTIADIEDGAGDSIMDAANDAMQTTIVTALPVGGNNIGDVDVLTVPAPLNVVGGGAEATALRVTIANDSTGTLTVDGTVTAANTAGDIADDAPDSGNPVKVGGVAVETDGTDPTSVSAEGDRAEVRTDLNRRLLVNDMHPNSWSNNNNYAAAQTDTEIQATPGANLSLYITDIAISVEGACNVTLVRNTAAAVIIYGPFYFAANGGLIKHFKTPIRLPANENLGVTSSAAVNHTISAQGYIAP